MKKTLRHSWIPFAIFGIFPLILMFFGLGAIVRHGNLNAFELIYISLGIIGFLALWNRGTYVTLEGDKFTYRKFLVLKKEIRREEISRCKAFTSFDMRVGSPPPFCLDIFVASVGKRPKKPAIRINLKPFDRPQIEEMFEWLPNLDRSKYKSSIVKGK